jgi:hypothetical protein
MKPENWPSKLLAAIESRRTAAFEWGSNDCVKFAFSIIEEVTGEDKLNGLTWGSAREAAELLAAQDLVSRTDGWLGQQISPKFASRGDVVAVDINGRLSLAICTGTHAIGPGADGAVFVPMELAVHAWRAFGED